MASVVRQRYDFHARDSRTPHMDPDEDYLYPGEFGDALGRVRRRLLWSLLIVLLVTAGLLAGAYYFSQQEPDFYRSALRQSPEAAKRKGTELESKFWEIYNAVLEQDRWRGEVSQDQINGWLATELLEKFPELLSEDVISKPRVAISRGEISIAGRAQYHGISGIVVGKLDCFKTDQNNSFAIRFRSFYAGIIPVPIKSFADQITKGFNHIGYQTKWTELEGDPLLIVIVPEEDLIIHGLYRLDIETIDIEQEKIVVSGKTVNQVEEEAQR